jgi:hypothetical protein
MLTPPGRVVFFTGPAAAGKSTIAAAWAASRSAPTAHMDHDQARFLVRAGYISRSAAHADPALREPADRQWLLAAAVCEAMAATYMKTTMPDVMWFWPPWRLLVSLRSGVWIKGLLQNIRNCLPQCHRRPFGPPGCPRCVAHLGSGGFKIRPVRRL